MPVPPGYPADVVVVNSCTVTRNAEKECIQLLTRLRTTQPGACLVLTGCATETCGADMMTRGLADLIVPQSKKDNIVPIVMRHLGKDFVASAQPIIRLRKQRATLKVQDGCPFACSYCVVPIARGNVSRSRPFKECLAEARMLIASGFQEIVVAGCNTACYSDAGLNLIDLLRALARLPGLGRLRLGSIEPGTIERDLVKLMQAQPKICRYLHVPLQSGDNTVLRRMRRRYTIDNVKNFLDEAYRLLPDLSVGTDLIVGFPGETEEAFVNTCALMEAYPFSNIHVFPYSPRPKTAAAAMPDQIIGRIRRRRTTHLIKIANERRLLYMQRFIGRPVTLLVEWYDPQGCARGWSAEYLPCVVADSPPGLCRTLHSITPTRIRNDTLIDGPVPPLTGNVPGGDPPASESNI